MPSGGTDDRPSEPNVGEPFWDTDLDSLVVWDGSSWVPVASDSVEVPTGGSTERLLALASVLSTGTLTSTCWWCGTAALGCLLLKTT